MKICEVPCSANQGSRLKKEETRKPISLGYGGIVRSSERDGHYLCGWDNDLDDNAEFTKKELNAKIITDEVIIIQISYPLDTNARFVIKSRGGFTLKQVIDAASDCYHYVYDKEDETSEVKAKLCYQGGNVLLLNAPLLNRCATNGKYGIWGHEIGDLTMHTLSHEDNITKLELATCGIRVNQQVVPVFNVKCDS